MSGLEIPGRLCISQESILARLEVHTDDVLSFYRDLIDLSAEVVFGQTVVIQYEATDEHEAGSGWFHAGDSEEFAAAVILYTLRLMDAFDRGEVFVP